MVILFLCESPDEDGSSVPDDLKDLAWWDFRDINFKVGVSVVPSPSIEPSNEGYCIEPTKIGEASVVECTKHIYLGSPDVSFMLVVDSVLVEPIIDVGLEIDVISKVSGPGGGDEETMLIGYGVVVVEILGGPLVVLRDQSEAKGVF